VKSSGDCASVPTDIQAIGLGLNPQAEQSLPGIAEDRRQLFVVHLSQIFSLVVSIAHGSGSCCLLRSAFDHPHANWQLVGQSRETYFGLLLGTPPNS
jgi:hypothetical protein